MKKKYMLLSLFAVCLTTFASCDMEEVPSTSIATSEAVRSADDCKAFREYFYARFRGYFGGGTQFTTEAMTDEVHALAQYGNYYGAFYRWEAQASDGAFSSAFSTHFTTIANVNFLLEGAERLLNDNNISEADKTKIKLYIGEAYFTRAFAYNELAQFFCKDYDVATAATEMGIPLVTVYAPTSNAEKYPARSSLKDTYDFIMKDLVKAEEMVTTAGSVASAYVTADVVKALKARVALQMEDYDTAINAATGVINKGTYELLSDKAAFADMWLNDTGTEALWQIAMSKTELGNGTYGSTLIGLVDKLPKPSYIPESGVLSLYDKQNDMRYVTYFSDDTVDIGQTTPVIMTIVKKFQGNKSLYEGKSNYVNKIKPFRIAEMYLVAAEAYAMKGDASNASSMLNILKTARIEGWQPVTYTTANVMQEVKSERRRELYLEGFRLNDMKRWHEGLTRTAPLYENASYYTPVGLSMTKAVDDNRWVWAIPQNEIDANPQMKNQQNPGY